MLQLTPRNAGTSVLTNDVRSIFEESDDTEIGERHQYERFAGGAVTFDEGGRRITDSRFRFRWEEATPMIPIPWSHSWKLELLL